jgi:hypothetical protein
VEPVVNLIPWDSATAITIICTGGGTHPLRRLGEVDAAGIVVTLGGDKDRRRPAPVGSVGSGMMDIHPEQCPKCRRTPRLTREDWQKIVAAKVAVGEPWVDVSYLP